MRISTTERAAGLLVALALVTAACGGDDDAAPATAPPATEAPSTTGAPAGTDPPSTTVATEGDVDTSVTDNTMGDSTASSEPVAGDEGEPDEAGTADPDVIEVPADHETIQAAVDAAAPGALILVAPGVYDEAVNVTTDRLTIRGLDRDEVVLDGGHELDNGVRVLGADGVAVENMTARNYTRNGFFWTGVDGYRGSYLTSYRTGDYGVYAFDSVRGQIEHSYAAGSPDAGFYIGQCFPCDAVIDQVVSEHNGLGYSGTNSGGNLSIVRSTFRNNRAGVVPNSGSYELCYPERETTIVGNAVYSNNQPDTPAISVAILAMGNGILVAGGVRNTIERNAVWDHDRVGIGLVPFLEDGPNDDMPPPEDWDRSCDEQKADPVPDDVPESLLWDAFENRVADNAVDDSREADLALASAGGDISRFGNCFGGNSFATAAPEGLEQLAPCDGDPDPDGDWAAGDLDVTRWLAEQETRPPPVDYREATLPPLPELPDMPDAASAPARPATDVPFDVDLDALAVPEVPERP